MTIALHNFQLNFDVCSLVMMLLLLLLVVMEVVSVVVMVMFCFAVTYLTANRTQTLCREHNFTKRIIFHFINDTIALRCHSGSRPCRRHHQRRH